VVSPFTKGNYVSHTVMDYTAILKFIETRFNLPSLTARDAAQPDMTEFFDFVSVPWATPPSNIPTQDTSMSCVLEALSAVSIAPNPVSAGSAATVTLSLTNPALDNVTVALSASSASVVPSSVAIASGASSVQIPITAPSGITSLTVTGSIGGIPMSGTVKVE
jgi:phospholipase C